MSRVAGGDVAQSDEQGDVVDGQADVDVQLPQQRGRDGQGHVSLEGSGDVPVDLRRVPGVSRITDRACLYRNRGSS